MDGMAVKSPVIQYGMLALFMPRMICGIQVPSALLLPMRQP